MKFTILVSASPLNSSGAHSAYQFCSAVLAQQQTILQIFFYGDGVYNAQTLEPATNSTRLLTCWQALAKTYSIPLLVCVDAAQNRGLLTSDTATQLTQPFTLASLRALTDAMSACERFITFN